MFDQLSGNCRHHRHDGDPVLLDGFQHLLEGEMRKQNESQSSDHVIQNAADAERVVQRQHDDVEVLAGRRHVFGQLPIEELYVNIPF